MKLKINNDEFEDGLQIVFRILSLEFHLVDFYVDDKEVIHITFRKAENG